jgi:hypothetical protein
LLRLLASVKFGIVLLVLILVYASVVSALPQVRGALEMTEMGVFQHWIFATLVALLSLSLVAATCSRVRWRPINAGTLIAHVGVLLLVGGSFWYFATKIEGDVILLSPRIELRTPGGQPVPGASLRVAEGQVLSRFVSAIGADVRVEVLNVGSSASPTVTEARVRVQLGEAPPETVRLSLNEGPAAMISGRLAVALESPTPARVFFDDEIPALYYRRSDEPEGHRRSARIEGLPLHRERYLDEGYLVRDRAGRLVLSQRISPAVKLAGLMIPTGWFEPWRLPIKLDTPDLPFDVTVTGYLPYVAGMQASVRPGGPAEDPAAHLNVAVGDESIQKWLLARDPAGSLLNATVPFEFRWVRDEPERDELLRPLAGPHELTIEVRDPPARMTLAVTDGQTVPIDGTPYELTVKQLIPSWPLLTPGFEGAHSPIALVDVSDGERSYTRTVVARFPQLSRDIDEQGVRHETERHDSNLILRYRTSATGWVLITAGPDLEPIAGVFDPDGSLRRLALTVGTPQSFTMRETAIALTLHGVHRNARVVPEPVIEPVETRRPSISPRGLSAIRLKLTGRGAHLGWTEDRWVLFSPYPHVDARPIRVQPPGEEVVWELVYSRLARDLGAALIPDQLTVTFFPGRRSVKTWRSDFFVRRKGSAQPAAVYTNHTYRLGRWTLYQSGAAEDHWSYTILGVGNRNGIGAMVLGCVLITLGCLYAFYIQPILRRRAAGRDVTTAPAEIDRLARLPARLSAGPESAEVCGR